MTLDEDDVNGFRQTAQGKRANKKNKGKKGGGGKKEDPALVFGDSPYEPSRPCDYVSCATYAVDAPFAAATRGARVDLVR